MSEIYEGNSITVNNINKSKAKIKNRGGSWQATRSGYNLANLDADSFVKNGVTVTNNGDGSWTFNGKSSTAGDLVLTKNVLLSNKIYQFEDAKYLFKTIVVSGSFSNPDNVLVQTSAMGQDNGVDNFGTLYNKLSDGVFANISNKKSTSHLSRFELFCGPNVTFNNYTIKILFAKTDNKELEWEQYGVSPSPDFPSEIKNVGDDVNLAYISSKKNYNYSSTLEKDVVLINGTSTNAGNIELYLNGDDGITLKANKKYIVSLFFDGHVTGNGYKKIYLQGMPIGDIASNKMVTKEIILSEDKVCKTINLDLSANCTFDNMKVKVMITENRKLKEYIPYNCIKATICNKNLYKVEKVINDTNNSRFIYKDENGNVSFTTGGMPLIIAPTTIKEKTEYTYILKCKSNVTTENNINFTGIYEDGTRELLSANKKKDTNEFIVKFKTNKEKTLAYVTQQYTNSARVTIITEGTMILEGDYLNLDKPYEIHQEQEITFPLAEGQKLYEGSYLAKDGIHNKRISINGNEYKNTAGMNRAYSTENYNCFDIYTGLKFVKSENQYKTIGALCNQFKEKNWASFWQQKVNEEGFCINQDNRSTIYIKISKEICPDIDTFKKYIDENNLLFEIPLEQEEIIPYTQEQQNAFYQLQNIVLYDGINHISTDNELGSMSVEVSKIIEDYETYISSNGFFINSQNDIHYLIDFSESELPCMAEATETTVKAAGRNGDIVLSTTYDPNNFNIVCYTEDNLTQEEKVKEEMKLKKLLNSIKNKTIPLAFEKDDKFYKVKYSGAFSSTNFPKHLKFSIPLKTSESYGKDLIKKVIFGNGEETSDTFEDVGAIFTIKGPANSPIISLNDYSIEYDNPLLEGDKLIINSSNSTITHINSDGVKTNAMRYYNHQFPKIENGKNVLKVLSGVNEANVSVEWYDYKF